MSLSNAINASKLIDRRSYILGMMTAFAECVTNECKKIALQAPVRFLFSLFFTETQLKFAKSAMSFGKRQGWYLNPFQPRKSAFSSTIVTVSTFINFDSAELVAGHLSTFFTSAFRLPTSDFQSSSLPSGAASSPSGYRPWAYRPEGRPLWPLRLPARRQSLQLGEAGGRIPTSNFQLLSSDF